MKRKGMKMLALLLAAGILGGCGSDKNTSIQNVDVEKYVTLGEYKGLEVTAAPIEVDENNVQELFWNIYSSNVTKENGGITDRAVEMGDTAHIDFEGKKDGVPFAGGSTNGQGSLLTIGSGRFIEGFEEGLIGVMPGETVDLNLTFPENYGAADLAGQDVVFTVTVNYIISAEVNNDIVAGLGIENVSNEAELRQFVHDYLYSEMEGQYQEYIQGSVMDALMKNCTFNEVPEDIIAKYVKVASESVEKQAASHGVDKDTFTNSIYGKDFATFVETYSREAAKQDLVMQAVANKENITIDDEELNTLLAQNAAAAGYENVEDFVGENSLEEYRQYLLFDKVLNYLVENANITE